LSDRTSSSSWVRGLLDMFAEQGVDGARLLAAAAIRPARLEDPNGRFGADEVSLLWDLAVAASGNPLLGVDRGLAERHANFDLVGFASVSSRDLRAALMEFTRYLDLISSATVFELQPDADGAWLVMGHTGYQRPLPPQRSSYSVLALLTLCRWVSRRGDLQPLAVQFQFLPPGDPRAFEQAFGAPVRFGSADNRMLLSAQDLAVPLPARNPDLLALHEQAMDERLAALGDASISARVSEAIALRLDQGEPRREDIAASLALTDRALQRRLQAEHTTFGHLLDEARRELARKYLADSQHALAEMAYRLGFADQSNFFRACKRWFGSPPGQVREQLAAARRSG
jgi:AraC-like DNA-binding protein